MDNLIIKGFIDTINKEDRIFQGWGSVQVIDRQGDYINISEFKPVMEKLISNNHTIPIQDSHTNHNCGEIIKVEFLNNGEGQPGIYLTAKIYSRYSSDDDIWNAIKDGQYTGFSLGGKAGSKEPVCNESGCFNLLKDIEIWEFSIVETPANQGAIIDNVNKLAKSYRRLYKCYAINKSVEERDRFQTELTKIFDEEISKIMLNAERFSADEMKQFTKKVLDETVWKMQVRTRRHIEDLYKSGHEYVEKLIKRSIDFSKVDELAINAILNKHVLWDSYENLSKSTSDKINEIITESYTDPKTFSIQNLVKKIRNVADEEAYRLERLVRTETRTASQKGREMGFRKADPENNYLYKWSVRHDARTSPVCKEIETIVNKEGGSVPLDRLNEILKTTSIRHGGKNWKYRDWTPHINCRSSLVRMQSANIRKSRLIKKVKVYVKKPVGARPGWKSIEKGRIYVLDPSEAPPGAKVLRGQYGGMYYESTLGRKKPPKKKTPVEKPKPKPPAPAPKEKPSPAKPKPAKPKPAGDTNIKNAEVAAASITHNADYTQTSFEVADSLNNHIAQRMQKVGHKFKDGKLDGIIFEDLGDKTNAANEVNSSNLYINSRHNTPEKWGKVWDSSKEYEKRNGTVWTAGAHYNRDEQMKFTIDHEMGHMLKDKLSKKELKKFNEVMDEAYNTRWRPVSEYAMSSDDELFAELYGVYMNGNKKGYMETNLLTDGMVKFFNDILGSE